VGRFVRLALWCALALTLGIALTRVKVDADLSRFVSADRPDLQIDLSVALQRGMAGRLVLIVLSAPTTTAAADVSRRMVSALRASGAFATVHNGDSGLLAAEVEPLLAFRYALSDRVEPAMFSEIGLRSHLRDAEAMLADARAWVITQLLPLDPTLETLHLAEQWNSGMRLPLRHGVWFTRGSTDALIIATTRAVGDNASGQKAVEAAILQEAAAVGVPQLKYSGLGLLAAEARDRTRTRVERLGWVSAVLVTLILYLGYRRLLPVVLSMLPVALGIAAGGVLTHVFFGDVNLLAVAFACILVDEGSDYASYLLTQARPGQPLGAEARRIWPTLRLAVLTSTASFAVLLLAQFRGLQQLGLLCGVGLLVAGAAARWLLPDLLNPASTPSWSPPRVARISPTWLNWTLPSDQRRYIAQLAAAVVALLVLSLASPVWDDGVAAINPLPPDRIAADRALRSAAGLPLDQGVLLFAGADDEAVLQAQEAWLPALRALQSNGVVETFDLAARYLPSVRTQQQRLAAVPEAAMLAPLLQRAVQGTAFNVDAFAPFLESVRQMRSAVLTQAALPDGLFRQRVESLLLQLEGRSLGLVPVAGRASRDELLASARQAMADRPVTVEWFEPRAQLSALLAAVRERLVGLLLLCVFAIFLVIALERRSLAVGIRVMIPVVTALLLTAALVRLGFGPLTVFNLVALMLVLGVITNYSLFIHAPPAAPDDDDRRAHTVFSLIIASATTLAVFGALGLSDIRVVESVGQTVVVGIIVGLAWLIVTRGRGAGYAA
jgi:predicted exporter